MPQKSSNSQTFTYQTRPHQEFQDEQILAAYAALMATVERRLFSDISKGKQAHKVKSEYLKRYGITARQFNAIRVQLEGKIASIIELRKERIEDLKRKISSLESAIQKLQKKENTHFLLHQKKRRLKTLQSHLASLEKDRATKKVRLCFGSRKLFSAQFSLFANGYASHEEWKNEWTKRRSNSFFLLGSKDETAGNQSCVATVADDGSLTFRLRVPNVLSRFGKYLVLKNVRFSYGHDTIVRTLKERKKDGTSSGVALCYRFINDEKGWWMFLSLPVEKPKQTSRENIGVIGIDINANHLALVETDRNLNPIRHEKIALSTYGKDRNQAKALIGDVVKHVVNWCVQTQKPLVIEKLSFGKKKSELKEIGNPRYSRMLSSFAYNAITMNLKSRSFRDGISITEVDPAYTSVIGKVKFAKRYGLSAHEAAALCIGRRALGGSERLPRHMNKIHIGHGIYGALPLPVRNRGKHVWSSWRQIKKELLAAHAAHSLAARKRSKSRPLPTYCDTKKVLGVVDEISARESTTELLGCRI
jgi:IS605 OrfB family transposase